MKKPAAATRRRVNISLSDETLRLLDRVVPKGGRSQLIERAVRAYISAEGRTTLKQQIVEGAKVRSARDLALVSEWFTLEEEVEGHARRRR
jgi:metal-responsive CopG/Arc/MetJ family transcriptional regulator